MGKADHGVPREPLTFTTKAAHPRQVEGRAFIPFSLSTLAGQGRLCYSDKFPKFAPWSTINESMDFSYTQTLSTLPCVIYLTACLFITHGPAYSKQQLYVRTMVVYK